MVLFSVIIPTYNRAGFLKKAIDSVFLQTYSNWEVIVIDDASTDETQQVLMAYNDPRFFSYKNPINLERSKSRNIGIDLAQGDYICFLDSDDYFLPGHLKQLADLIQSHSNLKGLFHTGVKQIDHNKQTETNIQRPSYQNQVEGVLDTHIPIHSVAIHREILKEFNFDAQVKINEDVHLFSRIAAQYPVVYTPEVSVVWVLHGSNTIHNEIDYITPQLVASKMIFKDPYVSLQLSSGYKNKKYFSLYSQLVHFHAIHRRYGLAGLYFIKGIGVDPLNKDNKNNFLNVIYHLPGGSWMKKCIQLFNRHN